MAKIQNAGRQANAHEIDTYLSSESKGKSSKTYIVL